MLYQKFAPEGWNDKIEPITRDVLDKALLEGNIMEGRVTKCDLSYNLYVELGNSITGVIPREEVELINTDGTGFPKPNICTSKVGKMVQFKVKDISKDDIIILSRKSAQREAINWVRNDLKEGTKVSRNSKKYQTIWRFH